MPRSRRIGLLSLIAAVACGASLSHAASPGVPALPTTSINYVKYAVTDLPTHFKNQPLGGINNTPANNPITNAGATLVILPRFTPEALQKAAAEVELGGIDRKLRGIVGGIWKHRQELCVGA